MQVSNENQGPQAIEGWSVAHDRHRKAPPLKNAETSAVEEPAEDIISLSKTGGSATQTRPAEKRTEKRVERQLSSRSARDEASDAKPSGTKARPDSSAALIMEDRGTGTLAVLGDEGESEKFLEDMADDSAVKKIALTPVDIGEYVSAQAGDSRIDADNRDSKINATPRDAKINATPCESQLTGVNPLEALSSVVEWISSPDKKEFCLAALKACQKEFYAAPASYSGKYHPKENLGEGGLIRHIRKCAFYARKLASIENLSNEDRDTLIAATVLHDICKGGIPWKAYAADHGPIAEKWLENFDPDGRFASIRHLVGMHMGEFNSPLPTPPQTAMEHYICQVDMLGSSKALGIENLKWNKEAEIPLSAQGDGSLELPIISNIRDCMDQIGDPKIREFVRVTLLKNRSTELTPDMRDKFIYGMDVCRIEKAEGVLRDQIIAAVILNGQQVPPPATNEDFQVTGLKTLMQRPAHFYPEQGRKILQKALALGTDSPDVIEKFVNLSNDMLKTDKPAESTTQTIDLRTGKFDISAAESSLARIEAMAREISENPEILKKRDKDTSASLKNLKEVHKLLHSAASVAGYTQRISGDLEKAHLILSDIDDAKQRIKRMDREIKWEKVTAELGDDLSPVSKEYFFQNDDIKADEMIEVLSIIAQLRDPESDVNIKGNAIVPLHRAEIWQQKMNLLDSAIEHPEENGKPVEIDVEYYELSNNEMLAKLLNASEKGCKVRVMIDPGHAPNLGKAKFNISDIVRRMKSVQTLMSASDHSDIAVGIFPAKEILGSKDALMHRKLFRVGESVILGGMNANTGSGENIDAAQLIKGPAARRLGEIFAEDLKKCAHTSDESLYGTQVVDLVATGKYMNRSKEEVTVERIINPEALLDLISTSAGATVVDDKVTPALVREFDTLLQGKGIHITDMAEFYDLDGDDRITENDIAQSMTRNMISRLVVSDKGGEVLAGLVDETLALCNSPENLERLNDVEPPAGEACGPDQFAIGSETVERQAIILHAIESAERFIYIPTFVMTEGIARALAAKKRQMEAEGKSIDIRVIIDSGLYGYGSTPNERGFFALEDAGIPVRWSLLNSTNMDHARKIHAKEIITDKALLTGSTNMSAKGMRTNWELSGISYFDDNVANDPVKRESAKKDFMRTLDEESIEINTRWLIDEKMKNTHTKDIEIRKREARRTLLLKFLREIDNYQKQVGSLFEEMEKKPEVQIEMKALMEEGYDRGYALLLAAKKNYPSYILKKQLEEVPAWANLENIRTNPHAK